MQRLLMIECSPQPFPPRTPQRRTVMHVPAAVLADTGRPRVTGINRRAAHRQYCPPAHVRSRRLVIANAGMSVPELPKPPPSSSASSTADHPTGIGTLDGENSGPADPLLPLAVR